MNRQGKQERTRLAKGKPGIGNRVNKATGGYVEDSTARAADKKEEAEPRDERNPQIH